MQPFHFLILTIISSSVYLILKCSDKVKNTIKAERQFHVYKQFFKYIILNKRQEYDAWEINILPNYDKL